MIVHRFKIGDMVILFILMLVIWIAWSSGRTTLQPKYVQVNGPAISYRYVLSEDRVLSVEGRLGLTVFEIREGSVSVLSDPGPRKISVHHRPIARNGEWIASLPNQILLTIVADDKEPTSSAVDDVAF